MNQGRIIDQFVTRAIQSGGWMEMDRLYLKNRLMQMVGLEDIVNEQSTENYTVDQLVNALLDIARNSAVITHEKQEESLKGQLYDLLTPPPSVLNALFAQQYNDDPTEALSYFHRLSIQNKMIKHAENTMAYETSQGMLWTSETTCEKYTSHYYPACDLCFDNEGYASGKFGAAFRYIRMNLQGKSFGFRFYQTPVWENHCLFVAEEHHTQMHQRQTVDQLLQIVDVFPNYFVTCDSDLVKNADHVLYEGGSGTLPLFERYSKAQFTLNHYPQLDIDILDYPLTTCRIKGKNKEQLMQLVASTIQAWRLYQAEGLCAFLENGEMQHSVMLAARKQNETYEVYLLFCEMTRSSLSLYEAFGVEIVDTHQRAIAEQLGHNLKEADPFEGNHQRMDQWMQKINTLGAE